MTQTAALVQVSIVAAGRRVDLAVPGTIPVADLLPELASAAGVLDAHTVHRGYRLVQPDGRVLVPEAGLVTQGVEHGSVLVLEAEATGPATPIYDDLVEAVAAAVEAQSRPLDPASSRRAALSAAALLLGIGAVALGLMRSTGGPVAAVGAALAGLLICATGVLARAQREPEAAVVAALLAVPYAAVAGLAAAPSQPALRLPLALVGVGVLVVSALAMFALVERRPVLLPPAIIGAVVAGTGAVLAGTDLRPGVPAAAVVGLSVLAGLAGPALAMAVTRIKAFAPRGDAETQADPEPIDSAAVAEDVRVAHEVFLALVGTLGLLVTLAAPLVVQFGGAGAALVGCASAALILRTRRYRARHEVAAGLGGGVAGLVVLGVAGAIAHPGWRPAVSLLLALAGALLLLVAAVPPTRPSLRLGRVADVAEGVAVVGLLPLLALVAEMEGRADGDQA